MVGLWRRVTQKKPQCLYETRMRNLLLLLLLPPILSDFIYSDLFMSPISLIIVRGSKRRDLYNEL